MILLAPLLVFCVWLIEDPSHFTQAVSLATLACFAYAMGGAAWQSAKAAWRWFWAPSAKRFAPVLNVGERLPDLSELSDHELDLLASRYKV